MRARHANLFHTVSPTRFDQSIRNLKRQAPGLSPLQMALGIEAIVASVRDGHTRVVDNRIGYRRYPLRLYWYRDGVFVQAAHQRWREAVGGRVVRVGGLPIDQAIDRVATVVPRDNDYALHERVPWRLVTPEILGGLGIVEDMQRAQYEIVRDGKHLTIEVAPLAEAPLECEGVLRPLPADWVEARQPAPYPLWLKNPCQAYTWPTTACSTCR